MVPHEQQRADSYINHYERDQRLVKRAARQGIELDKASAKELSTLGGIAATRKLDQVCRLVHAGRNEDLQVSFGTHWDGSTCAAVTWRRQSAECSWVALKPSRAYPRWFSMQQTVVSRSRHGPSISISGPVAVVAQGSTSTSSAQSWTRVQSWESIALRLLRPNACHGQGKALNVPSPSSESNNADEQTDVASHAVSPFLPAHPARVRTHWRDAAASAAAINWRPTCSVTSTR